MTFQRVAIIGLGLLGGSIGLAVREFLPGTATTLLMQASAACYQTETLRLEGLDIVTSKPRTEAYRGPGGIQADSRSFSCSRSRRSVWAYSNSGLQ